MVPKVPDPRLKAVIRPQPSARLFVVAVLACAWFALPVSAGKYNPTLSIGDAAPGWEKLEGVDGKPHSLADLAAYEVVVVCFTCNTCPYSVDVEDRLNALAKEFAAAGNRAVLVAINPNKVRDDLLPAMRERAQAKGFSFAYLHDGTQAVTRSYGATRTPELFVLNKERKIVYMGALDDSPGGKDVKMRYVAEAVAATLAGAPVAVTETPPIGCAVRLSRPRRTEE